jgi:hypothetical protein
VEGRHTKYQVEELVENCGAQDVINNLRVHRPGQEYEAEGMTSSKSQTARTAGRTASRDGDNKGRGN